MQIIYQLPNIKFLDSGEVTVPEKKEAKRIGPYLKVARPTEQPKVISFSFLFLFQKKNIEEKIEFCFLKLNQKLSLKLKKLKLRSSFLHFPPNLLAMVSLFTLH